MHLKKWFLGAVATACLLSLSLLCPSVRAAETTEGEGDETQTAHTHCICGGAPDSGNHTDHADVTYTAWNGGDFDYDGGDTGTAYLFLDGDVADNAHSCNRTTGDGILEIKNGQTLYLCLNGHALRNAKTDNNVIDICSGGKLVLCDCTGGGTIGGRESGANSGAIWLDSGSLDLFGGSLTGSSGVKNGGGIYAKGSAVIRMYGGSITGNRVIRQGGGVFLSGSATFEMFGGAISDNSSPEWGGGVVVDGGTSFIMRDGAIENNTGNRAGGGLYVGGTFRMLGGTIRGNSAGNGGGAVVTMDSTRGTFIMEGGSIENNHAFGNGGGVLIWDRGTMEIKGGVITGNEAAYGGGICLYSADKVGSANFNNILTLSGGIIEKNKASLLGGGVIFFEYSELHLQEGMAVTVTDNGDSNFFFADKCTFVIEGLTAGSSIGVSHYAKPQKGTPRTLFGGITEEMSRCFFSDDPDSMICYHAGDLQLTADFYTATVRFETGCDTTLPDLRATGLTETVTATLPGFSPDVPCRRFLGWADSADATAAQYTEGNTLTLTGDITLYAVWEDLPHDFVRTAEVSAACGADGTKAHLTCSHCHRIFIENADGTQTEVTAEQLVISGGHRFGTWQDEVPAAVGKDGSAAHKDCEVCHKHFDADGNEITDIVIPALTPEPSVDDPAEKKENTLSTGAVVGITAGGVVGTEAALLALFWFVFKKKNFAQLIAFFKG